ncbi:molybdopterin converting factor subunit 1 [Sinorhizobium alkalisoli]|uniref:Molybdopterin converting factor subunit 1 n=1 Tax=Sinorhizobium alkalisoli TaxID=1752398 RepID=A0A1E3V6G6_9HYPH|nr:molybdopterin converting factor subunit 1 [Sinorhizobium alkalisoli]MCA1490007.1 molybdopterin converting factor subunit 1 [Ensifer sp. NBAIM29]MCG5478065.1 molybdopterin converting factor subunit 1 [Sinorhizobium alkalisoli]ODR89224.1 molybdopterin converting factor subunit 1 [Sinorhizobium alkalisoli]QFI65677.1 Molybdenum cofactor biosynthesis protein MoaD [Sinorhizobium alkalisoli]
MSTVNLVYFSWVRERIGKGEETLELPADVVTIADLLAYLKTLGAEYEAALEHENVIRAAIDREHVAHGEPVAGAREIALFPPMTGG